LFRIGHPGKIDWDGQSAKAKPMIGRDCDIAIVGGGLSGALCALALTRKRPELAVRLIEAGPVLCGNHRWSWFASDLSAQGEELLAQSRKTQWDDGYTVLFPAYSRKLRTGYRSLASEDLAATLQREMPEGSILVRSEVAEITANSVTLRNGQTVSARAIIDCRGFATTGDLTGGWQVFMGRHMHLDQPHGLAQPVIMDAEVTQHDGYRFVYVLPLGAQDVFIEDTYYKDDPVLDRSALSARIDAYAAQQGWQGQLMSFETGVLPVITGGDFKAFQDAHRIEGVAVAGARGGFVHPLTSYTLPYAVETALAIAADADLPGDQLAAKLEARARSHWRAMKFYRLLGRMLFGAARPQERFRVFQHFYRKPENLVERFYSGTSTLFDRMRVLVGRPPVPISAAFQTLVTRPPRLLAPNRKDL